jgi:hypothetical protein
MACVIHGSQVVTQDVDICAPLTLENLSAICVALKDVHPRFRMSSDFRQLPQNPGELVGFKTLYLVTDLGQLDVLSEVAGVGKFPDVEEHSIPIDLAEMPILVLDLDTLILAKGAMNTPKDRQVVIELSAIRERLRDMGKK